MDNKKLETALGPLAPLYFDPEVLEIMVDNCDRTLVEKEGKLIDAGVKFDSPEAIKAVVEALLSLTGKQLKPEETVVHIPFPESQARAVAIFPPTAIQGPHLVIRKLMNTGWITWENLLEWNSISKEAYEFLQKTMRLPVNVLVVGGMGSGKTTVANRIAELIPPENRLVIVEDFHELQIQHPRAVYLEAVTVPNVSVSDLIRTGSIMRPDWLIIGELIGAEAMTAMEVMSRGHTGMTTLHANSPEDAPGTPGRHVPDGKPGPGSRGNPGTDRRSSPFDHLPAPHARWQPENAGDRRAARRGEWAVCVGAACSALTQSREGWLRQGSSQAGSKQQESANPRKSLFAKISVD